MNVRNYKTLVFDCDGVVLDSNSVKTQAFYNAALAYGTQAAEELRQYHTENGGISRYKKFEYFLSVIVADASTGPDLDGLLNSFAVDVKRGLQSCKLADGLEVLREQTQGIKWMIVSGGDQDELREVFANRGLDHYFDGGIFGSPSSKENILEHELSSGNIVTPALFIGDSRYDHVAAAGADLDFLFVRDWSEFKEYESYCSSHKLPVINALKDLLVF